MNRIDKILSNLGYCTRASAKRFLKEHEVLSGEEKIIRPETRVEPASIFIDGEPLDPWHGVVILMNKPCGYVCSHKEASELVYDLLPPRFQLRNPPLSTIGRLDKDTSGLLLITDDGELIHTLTSPKKHVPKIYEAELRDPLSGDEEEIFSSGTLLLEGEEKPLLPALLETLGERKARITVTEGRYHQVRRMFTAVGNHVEHLRRVQLGSLKLDSLSEGEYRLLSPEEVNSITSSKSPY